MAPIVRFKLIPLPASQKGSDLAFEDLPCLPASPGGSEMPPAHCRHSLRSDLAKQRWEVENANPGLHRMRLCEHIYSNRHKPTPGREAPWGAVNGWSWGTDRASSCERRSAPKSWAGGSVSKALLHSIGIRVQIPNPRKKARCGSEYL